MRIPELPPYPLILGRAKEKAQVLEHLRDPAVQIVTFSGPPGSGKTALALAAAHVCQRSGSFPGGVFWIGDTAGASGGLR